MSNMVASVTVAVIERVVSAETSMNSLESRGLLRASIPRSTGGWLRNDWSSIGQGIHSETDITHWTNSGTILESSANSRVHYGLRQGSCSSLRPITCTVDDLVRGRIRVRGSRHFTVPQSNPGFTFAVVYWFIEYRRLANISDARAIACPRPPVFAYF